MVQAVLLPPLCEGKTRELQTGRDEYGYDVTRRAAALKPQKLKSKPPILKKRGRGETEVTITRHDFK